MKKLNALFCVSSKLFLLGCLSLMGLGNTSHAEHMVPTSPCQKVMVDMEHPEKEDCDACEKSKEAWTQPFVQEVRKFSLNDIPQEVFFTWKDLASNETALIVIEEAHDPPDHIASQNSHLLITQSTVFRL